MEFQSGQNCVTEIKDMLRAKYIKTLCYIENRNIMRKIHKRYAQNAETLCSKCRNVMLKMQRHYAQNAETLCSKFGSVMLKMQKRYAQNAETLCAQNAETLCSKCGNEMQKSYAQKQISVIKYTVRG